MVAMKDFYNFKDKLQSLFDFVYYTWKCSENDYVYKSIKDKAEKEAKARIDEFVSELDDSFLDLTYLLGLDFLRAYLAAL